MTPDFRALCEELIEAVLSDDSHIDCMQIARRARALLAEPVAEGPTDEDLVEALRRLLIWPPRSTEAACEQDYTFARAVLARWGRPTPQPVAVSERLPGPEDCNAEGMCWWLIEPYPRPVGPGGKFWSLCRYFPGSAHWLPANALPTPEATND